MTATGTTAGRMLVIAANWYLDAANVISSITVSGESNATPVVGSLSTNVNGQSRNQIAYLNNLASGGTKTITITFNTSTYSGCSVMEYAGQDTTSQPDASTTITGFDSGGTTSCNTNITTTTANALIVAICDNNGQAITAGSGYTLWGGLPSTGGPSAGQVQDNVDAGALGSKPVTFTDPYSESHMGVVSFKALNLGGGTPVRHGVRSE